MTTSTDEFTEKRDLPFHKACVVIPTYNEKENAQKMVETIFKLYPDINLLFIDDGSPDGTSDVIESLQKEFSSLHIIKREGKLGLGTAYAAGFQKAIEMGFEFIVQMDCDFSHDPKEVKTLISKCQSNDLVIGSRYINGIRIINWPFNRLLLSYLASIYIRIVTGINVLDATGGFKCMKSSLLSNMDLSKLKSNGYIFQLEVNFKAFCMKKKIQEVPITFYERTLGYSKMDGGIIFEALISVIKLRILSILGKLV